MLVLKSILFCFFGWTILWGPAGAIGLPTSTYSATDYITATDKPDQTPLFFDAVLDFQQASIHETPSINNFSPATKGVLWLMSSIFYETSYYNIGRQIVVSLDIKAIIFPFHCFT